MRNKAVASLLVVAIIAGAGVGYFAGNQLTLARTSTEITWLTTTETALQSSASISNWRFVVSINATTIEIGQSLLLWANLTNTSPSNQTIRPFVGPYVTSRVVAANGTVVWTWEPPEVRWPNWNVTSGQTLSQDVDIPTASFRIGSYLVEVAPLITDLGQIVSNNFNLTLSFSTQVTICFGCEHG
jgi:hypothetical protein